MIRKSPSVIVVRPTISFRMGASVFSLDRAEFDMAVRITRDNPTVTAAAIVDELELEHRVERRNAMRLAVTVIRFVRMDHQPLAA